MAAVASATPPETHCAAFPIAARSAARRVSRAEASAEASRSAEASAATRGTPPSGNARRARSGSARRAPAHVDASERNPSAGNKDKDDAAESWGAVPVVDASRGFIGNPRASAGERDDASAPLPGSGTTGRTLDAPARTTPRNTPARTHGAGAAAWARRASSGRPPCVVIVGGRLPRAARGDGPGRGARGGDGVGGARSGRRSGGRAAASSRAISARAAATTGASIRTRGARPGECSQRGKILAGSTRRARRGGR